VSRADIAQQIKQSRAFRCHAEKAIVSLIKTTDMILAVEETRFREYNITPTQYNVLRILRGAGEAGLPVMEIGNRMLSRVPDVTRLLDRMEKNGFVERQRGRADRRSVIARLTDQGLATVNALDPVVHEIEARVFANITPEEIDALCGVLEKLRENCFDDPNAPAQP